MILHAAFDSLHSPKGKVSRPVVNGRDLNATGTLKIRM